MIDFTMILFFLIGLAAVLVGGPVMILRMYKYSKSDSRRKFRNWKRTGKYE